MYKIYTKENCPWCVKAKQLMKSCGVAYEELKLGENFTREDLQALLPKTLPLTVPQIFVYNKRIGGYEGLAEYFENHGIIGTQQ